jgi:DNA-binding LytR/AlgR family response regulator
MMHVIIVDEVQTDLEALKKHLIAIKKEFKQLQMFEKASSALIYINNNPVDLIILNIPSVDQHMVQQFREVFNGPILYTSYHPEDAVISYDNYGIDFLLKPYNQSRIERALDRASAYKDYLEIKQQQAQASIQLRSDYNTATLDIHKIVRIEGLEDYCKFFLIDGSFKIFRITMKKIASKLPENLFVRIHKSHIISIFHCESFNKSSVTIKLKTLPIGRVYKNTTLTVLSAHFNKPIELLD